MDYCRALGAPVLFTQFVYSPAVPCLRGVPFGVEHLPALKGLSQPLSQRSASAL